MSKKMMQTVLGKGLFVAMLAVITMVSLGKAASVQAEEETIYVGQTVTGWIPNGDEIHWYKLEASPGTLVKITMTRKQRDLVPYLALRSHDGGDYVFLEIDHNKAWSDTAQVTALLPVSANGYWIEAASLGSTAGTFTLTVDYDSIRNQQPSAPAPAKRAVGYNVTLTIDKIICWDDQDDDGIDELEFEYGMREYAPTAAVNGPENKSDFWMQPQWEADTFVPLHEKVGANSSVKVSMKLKEDDSTSGDETLLNRSFTLYSKDLQRMAAGGAESFFYQPTQYSDGEAYTYEIFFSVQAEEIYEW